MRDCGGPSTGIPLCEPALAPMTSPRPDIPKPILKELRSVCLALPGATEEAARVGIRWCIAKKNFAHVLMIDTGRPPANAKAAGSNGPVFVITFRSDLVEFDPGSFSKSLYFKPVWWPNILGMVLDEHTDWKEVGVHLVASYRLLAPENLAATVRRV